MIYGINMFRDFDFAVLDDPEYKEDAVREDIVKPILDRLGYSPSGENKMVRSRSLEHPEVYMGVSKRRINIVPDYLLEIKKEPKWILDAKSPIQNIESGKNVHQAYSYAIHPDVRARFFALCNGFQFVVFDVTKKSPIAKFEVGDIESRWEELHRLLSPLALTRPELLDFQLDYGVHMFNLGAPVGQIHHFSPMGVPHIAKVNDELYSICVNILLGDEYFATSFDFGKKEYKQLLSVLPNETRKLVRNALRHQPYSIELGVNAPEVCIEAVLGDAKIETNSQEFIPLIVKKFSRYIKS
ncbi:type I restriction enzyme HsdR N-terminal domain-containing protein [Vibrio parahaemolyticus]|uniref:type I restriction enzyme HsdR N-terminal domain-containing protein n=1 Tax=Vibrio parahaemolyticus TaxID=670 RepID=UPI001E5A093E|nr:type I restriction enzyme HsdR N-terminal domain-containing protein [Vibrio parahaemolyticus]